MQQFTLNNGIRLVVVPLTGLRAITMEVFCQIGSKYETAGEHGLSHFLEHMAFKGTPRRLTASAVNRELDSKGASWNAGTGQEYTSYYLTTVRENLPWAVDLMADILQNPLMDEKEVLKERGVIIEEIRMYQDNPAMGMSGDFYDFMLGKSPIGCWDVSGRVKEITDYTNQNLITYRKKYLDPKRTVIAMAGDVDEKAVDLIKESWEKWQNGSETLPEVKVKITEVKEKIIKKQVEQGHFCIGVEGITWRDKRKYALKLLDVILAGNTSSKLFQLIREDRGWAYYVHSISESFAETGIVGVQSGVKIEKVDEAAALAEKTLLTFKDEVTEEELTRAKDYERGKLKLYMDRSGYWTGQVGESWLLENEIETPEGELAKTESVTIEEVRDLAAELFKAERLRKMVVKGIK